MRGRNKQHQTTIPQEQVETSSREVGVEAKAIARGKCGALAVSGDGLQLNAFVQKVALTKAKGESP